VIAVLLAAFAAVAVAAEPARKFELRGEIIPHPRRMAAVAVHAAASPFTKDALAGRDGKFRFKDMEPGIYTVSVYVPRRGEQRVTVNLTPSLADEKGRVEVKVRMDSGRLNRERAALVSARELSVPDKARREYQQATKKLSKRDVDGAVAHLEKAVEIAPQYAAAWNHLGTIAYQTGRHTDAEKYFRQAVEADPEIYEPVVNLGGVLLNLGNLDEAWKFNVEAVMRRGNDPLAHSQLGMTYLALNKLDLAEKHLIEARRLDASHFSNPQLGLAELYLRRKDQPKAASQLEEFLRYHPDWPQARRIRETIAMWKQPRRPPTHNAAPQEDQP
jgi:tetratricopeptide (TPR) repeat protein